MPPKKTSPNPPGRPPKDKRVDTLVLALLEHLEGMYGQNAAQIPLVQTLREIVGAEE